MRDEGWQTRTSGGADFVDRRGRGFANGGLITTSSRRRRRLFEGHGGSRATGAIHLSAANSSKSTMSPEQPLMPMLSIRGAAAAIEWYTNVLGAVEEAEIRLTDGDGRIGHAELSISGATFAVADEYPEYDIVGPASLGNTPVRFMLLVDDVDTMIEAAGRSGARILRPAADQFYGMRVGTIADPFGHIWMLARRSEQISPGEMQRRFAHLK
jgi:PhnB protein